VGLIAQCVVCGKEIPAEQVIEDGSVETKCERCWGLAIRIDSTPDVVLVKLIGPARLSRIVMSTLKQAIDNGTVGNNSVNTHGGKVPPVDISNVEFRK
jgi:hypothetical protein